MRSLGSPEWNVSMVYIAATFENSCACTSLDMPEWREMTEQIDWRVKQPSRVACFSEDAKCWGAWELPAGTKSRSSHHRSPGGERRGKRKRTLDDLPWKDERGPSSNRRTLELFQRQSWRSFWQRRVERMNYRLFREHRYHLELKWTH